MVDGLVLTSPCAALFCRTFTRDTVPSRTRSSSLGSTSDSSSRSRPRPRRSSLMTSSTSCPYRPVRTSCPTRLSRARRARRRRTESCRGFGRRSARRRLSESWLGLQRRSTRYVSSMAAVKLVGRADRLARHADLQSSFIVGVLGQGYPLLHRSHHLQDTLFYRHPDCRSRTWKVCCARSFDRRLARPWVLQHLCHVALAREP